jgi:hypothetical protein
MDRLPFQLSLPDIWCAMKMVCAPLRQGANQRTCGAIYFGRPRADKTWAPNTLPVKTCLSAFHAGSAVYMNEWANPQMPMALPALQIVSNRLFGCHSLFESFIYRRTAWDVQKIQADPPAVRNGWPAAVNRNARRLLRCERT